MASDERHSPGDWSEGKMRSALTDAAPAVRRYLFGMCGSWERSEEIAQETEARISKEAGPSKNDYVAGLETVLSFIECCYNAAKEELEQEEEEAGAEAE